MKKILVLVEGQTGEQFTKKNLCEACFDSGLQFIPVILSTKKLKWGINSEAAFLLIQRLRMKF